MFRQLFIRSKNDILNVAIFTYSLHKLREPYYTENAEWFKNDVHLLDTPPQTSQLSWLRTPVGQQESNMSTLYPKHYRRPFSSRSNTLFIAHVLLDSAV